MYKVKKFQEELVITNLPTNMYKVRPYSDNMAIAASLTTPSSSSGLNQAC